MARSLALVAIITWATLQGSLALWGFRTDAARRDFGYFVQSARMWRESGVLYENVPRVNLNPPHASVVLFTPLTWLPFDAAVLLWVVLQVASLVAALILIARELHLPPERLEWIVPTVVASAMTIHSWIEGQVGWVLLIGGTLAWISLRRKRQGWASLTLAGLISLKPQFAVLLMATTRQMASRVILIGGAALVAAVVVMGVPVWLSWLAVTQQNGLQLPPWNVSIAAMLYRTGIGNRLLFIYLPVALVIFGITWRAASTSADDDRRWVLWGLATLLIAPVTWVYYAAMFLGPLIAWGEGHGWPVLARVGIGLWLLPLGAVAWVIESPVGWMAMIGGAPYLLGAFLVWLSVMRDSG